MSRDGKPALGGEDPRSMALRCAIYTRKSTEEGLNQDFNTLEAQRESAEAYIRSQQQSGWVALAKQYDDGGCSGANLERPALQRLLEDMATGKVDAVVVYKVDLRAAPGQSGIHHAAAEYHRFAGPIDTEYSPLVRRI